MIFINWIVIGVGALMIAGTFATINSANATQFDHDFSLLLLIAGVVTLLYGTGIIDITPVLNYFNEMSEPQATETAEPPT